MILNNNNTSIKFSRFLENITIHNIDGRVGWINYCDSNKKRFIDAEELFLKNGLEYTSEKLNGFIDFSFDNKTIFKNNKNDNLVGNDLKINIKKIKQLKSTFFKKNEISEDEFFINLDALNIPNKQKNIENLWIDIIKTTGVKKINYLITVFN